jgi:hypothetical protein
MAHLLPLALAILAMPSSGPEKAAMPQPKSAEVSRLDTAAMRVGEFAANSYAVIWVANSQVCFGHKLITSRTGLAIKKDKAEKRARRKWRERVRWLMPWSWGQADWGKAKKRSYSCHKKHGTWRCKASAIPCAGWP